MSGLAPGKIVELAEVVLCSISQYLKPLLSSSFSGLGFSTTHAWSSLQVMNML